MYAAPAALQIRPARHFPYLSHETRVAFRSQGGRGAPPQVRLSTLRGAARYRPRAGISPLTQTLSKGNHP